MDAATCEAWSVSEMADLVRRLGSRDAATRSEAEANIQARGTAAVPVLASLLSAPQSEVTRACAAARRILVPVVGIAAIGGGIWGVLQGEHWVFGVLGAVGWAFGAALCWLSLVLHGLYAYGRLRRYVRRGHRSLERGAVLLSQMSRPEHAGLLLDAERASLVWATATNRCILEALARVLPHLTPADAARLSADQLRALADCLEEHTAFVLPPRGREHRQGVPADGQQLALALAIVGSYKHVTDVSALQRCSELVRAVATTDDARRVQEAAQQVLPGLEHRVAAERATQQLLRPASGSSASLLRAAREDSPAHPAGLVRPASPPFKDGDRLPRRRV